MKWKQLIYWRISRNQSFTSARTVMQRHLPLRVTLCVCVCARVRHKSDSHFGHCGLLKLVWAMLSHILLHALKNNNLQSSLHCFPSVFLSIFCVTFLAWQESTLGSLWVWTICLTSKWRKIKSPRLNRHLCDIHSIKFPVVVKYIFARGVWNGEHTEQTLPCCSSCFIFWGNEVIWQSWLRTCVSMLHIKVYKLRSSDLFPTQAVPILLYIFTSYAIAIIRP